MGAIYFDFVDVGFADGSDKFHHWSVITGVFHVAVVTPFFALLKRSKPDSLRTLFRVHVFGNLSSFFVGDCSFSWSAN